MFKIIEQKKKNIVVVLILYFDKAYTEKIYKQNENKIKKGKD